MAVEISRSLLQRIEHEASASPDLEICGLLFGQRDKIEAADPTKNVAAQPARFFEIDPAALLRAHREARNGGRRLIGCYHSHPGGRAWPSALDEAAAASDWLWLIVGTEGSRLFRAAPEGGLQPIATRFSVSPAPAVGDRDAAPGAGPDPEAAAN